MTLWPFCPRPEFTESMQWRSDVLRTYSAEQRIRLTDTARQTFGYEHAMTARQYERARIMMAATSGEWDLPVWAERQRVSVSGGATVVTVDTTASDYREDGKALLWASDEACEVVTVDTVNAGNLALAAGTSRAYSNGFICPVRTAYAMGGMTATRDVGPIVHVQTEWHAFDGVDLADDGLYSTYRTHPIVTTSPRVGAASFDEAVAVPVSIVDNGLSPPKVRAIRSTPDHAIHMSWMLHTLPDLWAVRQWLHSVRGMQKGFWLPTWTRGITLAASIAPSDTTITVRSMGLNGVRETGDLMLQTLAGVQHYFRYTSVATSGSNEVLTLSGAAGATIQPAAVDFLCPLLFCRLAQDRVELAHQYRGYDKQTTSIRVRAEQVPVP